MHTHAQTHQLKTFGIASIWSTHYILDIHTIERATNALNHLFYTAVTLKVKENFDAHKMILWHNFCWCCYITTQAVSRYLDPSLCMTSHRHDSLGLSLEPSQHKSFISETCIFPIMTNHNLYHDSTSALSCNDHRTSTVRFNNDQLSRTHLVTTTYSLRLVSPGWKSFLLATMSQRLQPRDKLKTIHSMLWKTSSFASFPMTCLQCFHRKQNKITRIWLVIAR